MANLKLILVIGGTGAQGSPVVNGQSEPGGSQTNLTHSNIIDSPLEQRSVQRPSTNSKPELGSS